MLSLFSTAFSALIVEMKLTLILLFLLLLVSLCENLEFLLEPKYSQIEFYKTIEIQCKASKDAIKVNWYKLDHNWTLVTNHTGLRVVTRDSTLLLFQSNLNLIHSSIYRCLATNHQGTIASRNVFVRAVVFDSFSLQVYDQYVIRGSKAVFKCQIPQQLKQYLIIIKWIKDDSLTIDKTGPKYQMINDLLIISLVSSTDHHSAYKCVTKNKITQEILTSISAGKLIVTDPTSGLHPRIILAQKDVLIEEEETAIVCFAQAFPFAQYFWIKNKKIISNQEILFLNNQSQSGVYTCKVNNSLGSDQIQTNVRIKEKISVTLEMTTIGKQLILNCSIKGQPIESIQFERNAFPVPNQNQKEFIILERKGGCYSCRVNDMTESVISHKCLSEDLPRLTHFFSKHVINANERLSLRCVAQGSPIPTISWTLDGQPISESQRIQFGDYVSSNADLIHSFVNISHARIEDSGLYECLASNSAGSVSHRDSVAISGPLFIRVMNNVTAVDGQTLVIRCPVVQLEVNEPKIVWTKGNKELLSERHVTYENGTLIIRDLNRQLDSGQYTCSAYSSNGQQAKQQLFIHVLKKPVLSSFAFPIGLTSGQTVIVTCSVLEGDQPIKLFWIKDNQRIEETIDLEVISMGDMGSSLVFRKIQKSHSGLYTCLAVNEAGNSTYSSQMVVRVPPKWTIEPSDRSCVLGETVRFDCQSDGFPVPVIRWKQKLENQREFRPISSNYRIQSLENGSLVIKQVDKSDQGHYVCETGNGIGTDLSIVVKLKVNVGAYFKTNFQLLRVLKGKPITVTCEVFGEKPLTIKWMKNRNELKNEKIQEKDSSVESTTSQLVISSAQRSDSSYYSCLAFNLFGQSEMNIQLLVEEVPDPPSNLQIIELNSRSVSLKWDQSFNGNQNINKYSIVWNKEFKLETKESHVTINDLKPQTRYEFHVTSHNNIGESRESMISVTTEEEVPEMSPKEIKVIAISGRSLKITWKGSSGDHVIKGYYIGYKQLNSEKPITFKTIEFTRDNNQMEFILNSLEKNQKYLITVQAFNNKGAGPQSQEIMGQTLAYDAPSTPKLSLETVEDVTMVNLTWSIDTDNPIKGFKLFWRKMPENWEELNHVIESSSRWFVVTSLQCGNNYQFYLLAFNDLAQSQASEMVSRDLTQISVGFPPQMSSLLSINSTQIDIHLNTWKSRVNCRINYFRIQYKLFGEKVFQTLSQHVTQETQQITLNGLKAGSWYSLLISAHNNQIFQTQKEYIFSTLTSQGGTVSPMSAREDKSRYFVVLIPISCALSVLLVICFVLLFVCFKRTSRDINSSLSMTQISSKKCETPTVPSYCTSQLMDEKNNEYQLIEECCAHSHHCYRH